MKKIKLYTIAAIASLLPLFSCEDFLDLNPTTQPSETTSWKTENDFNMALAGIYGQMRSNIYFNEQFGLFDALSDNMYAGHNEGSSGDICRGNIDSNMGGYISDIFKNAYSAVARVNMFLQEVEKNTTLPVEVKNRLMGEGLFFRAYHHSWVYLLYGDVPVVNKVLTMEEQYIPKESAETVYELIMQDYDKAIENLPDITYSESAGHITRGTAKAFKAKLMLQHAYKQGVPDIQEMTEIISILESIEGYSLQPEYSDLFEDSKQEDSPEIMFSVKNLAPNAASGYDMYMTNWLMYCPLRNLIDEFELEGEGEWKGSAAALSINEEVLNGTDDEAAALERAKLFEGRDKRLKATIFHSMRPFPEIRAIVGETDFTGFGCYKYLQRNLTLQKGDLLDGSVSPQDMIHMRYGYVLLMIAEAENEVNGPTQKVYDAINSIRRRAGQNELKAGLTQDEMRHKIRHEWRVETALEGLRYFEMKRWHILDEIENIKDPKFVDYQPKFEEKFYYWPLPQSEIDKAGGILIQNPNY